MLSLARGVVRRTPVQQLLRPVVSSSFHSTPTTFDAAPKNNTAPAMLERFNRIVFLGGTLVIFFRETVAFADFF